MNQWFLRRFSLIVAAEFVVLSAIVAAVLTNHLSGRAIGVVGLLNMGVFFIAFLLLFRKTRDKVVADDALQGATEAANAQTARLRRAIKAYKRLMIFFAITFIFGVLLNADAPPLVRAFGALFDLALIGSFYRSMRQSQAKLKLLGEPS